MRKTNSVTEEISAIVSSEDQLENMITELIKDAVARHDISVQGPPSELLTRYGVSYIDPAIIQHSDNPPKKEVFLWDDFGWVLAFAFSIPVAIFSIFAIVIFNDFQSVITNFFIGIAGGLFGAVIGALVSLFIKKRQDAMVSCQEQKGGFVLWITVSSPDKLKEIISILRKYEATNITLA